MTGARPRAVPVAHPATGERIRDHIPLAVCAAPLAASLALAYHDGGYFTTTWGTATIVLLGLLAVAVLLVPGRMGGRLGWLAAAGWCAFAAWQGLSAAWSDEPAGSTTAMGLTLLYAAAFVLVLVASRGAPTLRRLTELSLLVVAPVAVGALGARLLPGVFGDEVHGRLSTPISYWNNLALLFAFGLVLALGVASDPSRRIAVRAAAASVLPMFPLGILFAESRGALVAMIVGCVVLFACARERIPTAWMLSITVAVTVPLLGFANAQESLSVERVLQEPHDVEGRRVALALLLAGAVCALGALAARRISVAVAPGRRRLVIGGALGATILLVAVAALVARPPAGGPVAWADRQFESFKSYDPRARDEAKTVADRLAVAAGSGRWQNWGVAADQFTEAPIAGTGAGDYRFRWAAERDIDISVRNAHSLYLEVLGESGVIGLLLLLTPLGAVVVGTSLALRRRPPLPLARDLGIALAAGGVVAVHLAGDWAWQMPAVVLPAIVLGAAALTASGDGSASRRRLPAPVTMAIAGVALIALLIVAAPVASASRLDDARTRADAGNLVGALESARSARQLAPQSAAAMQLEGNLLADLGDAEASDAAFARALRASPRDWSIPADWAAALLRRGDARAARPLIRRALALNPREPRLALLRREVGL